MTDWQLLEFDGVTPRDAARRAMKQLAVDDRTKPQGRQRRIPSHQVPDFEPAVFADRLRRSDHMRDGTRIRERQQKPLIRNDSSVYIVDIADGVNRKCASDALVINPHDHGRETRADIFVMESALAGLSVGGRPFDYWPMRRPPPLLECLSLHLA